MAGDAARKSSARAGAVVLWVLPMLSHVEQNLVHEDGVHARTVVATRAYLMIGGWISCSKGMLCCGSERGEGHEKV